MVQLFDHNRGLPSVGTVDDRVRAHAMSVALIHDVVLIARGTYALIPGRQISKASASADRELRPALAWPPLGLAT
jgi:hypothetical protein